LYFVLLSGLVASFIYIQLPDLETVQFRSNLLFFVLINFSIIGIAVLAFVIGRNIVKLIFDRQEGILGSKLRTRLVLAFVGLMMVPTTILFLLASGLISSAMEGWFSRQVEEIVSSSIEVARDHYSTLEDYTKRISVLMKDEILTRSSLQDQKKIEEVINDKRKAYGVFSVRVVESAAKMIAESSSATSELADFREPPLREESIESAHSGKTVVSFEEEGVRQFVRTYLNLDANLVLVVTVRVNPEISAALGSVVGSYDEYKKLSFYKQPLKSSYVLALALITGLILFAAIWFAFYLAREISVPIQRLAEGTKEVSQGNLDVHIRHVADDEIGFLVGSFNRMIKDLKGARSELEERRQYLEAILSNLTVGVVAIDHNKCLTLANESARNLLGLEARFDASQNIEIVSLSLNPLGAELGRLLAKIERGEPASPPSPVKILIGGRQAQIICSADRVSRKGGSELGFVFILEDVTDLSMAHQMAAWREVARRIAHEIKNPLTPIKLSAQRLERLMSGNISKEEVSECVQAIVENVESIKRLANEFSNFARMPTAEFTPTDLNGIISDILQPFVEQNHKVLFQFIADKNLPTVEIDSEQFRRMLMNLVDNAVFAVLNNQNSGVNPKITLRTEYNSSTDRVILEISDNGLGIHAENKGRIFEPYFTTKQEGTGLGLAIVNSVISDHQGRIAVHDNLPHGTRFVVDIPLKQPHQVLNEAVAEA